jgi:hypothetical protein
VCNSNPAKPGDNLRIGAARLGSTEAERFQMCGGKDYIEWNDLCMFDPLRALQVLERIDVQALATHIMRIEPPNDDRMVDDLFIGLFESTRDVLPKGRWYSHMAHKTIVSCILLKSAEDLGIGKTTIWTP